ncbi:MAG: DUF5011 domain-containing protein, partial [Pseudomonadales bacterium]|nr:DUF5011 domain-containing protein [Pseudomonadales bacterium]
GGSESQLFRVTASSNNTTLIPDPTVSYTTPGATGTLQFTPLPDQYGSTTITVTVEDGGLDNDLDTSEGNATFSRSFDVTVTPVNDQPVITLTGETNLRWDGLRAGIYVDPGYHCIDVEEGDITNKVILSGDSVDLEKLLTYVIRYDCQDSAGNPAVQKSRTVTVEDSLPPVTSLHLDNKVIQRSDNTQTGVGGESNTNPSDTSPTTDNEVGIANRLPEPIYRETGLKQPDGSDVRSRQDWVGRAPAAAAQTPGLPTTTGWDRLDDPVTVRTIIYRIDVDGTSCQESCEVPQVDFSQRSTYLLKYDAQDKTDNYAEQIAFSLVLDDQTAPVITVAGDAAELVELSSRWSLAESTAADNIDGNLTASIRYRVENSTTNTVLGTDLTYAAAVELLHTNEVATYWVTMTVSDNAGIYGKDNANNTNMAMKVIQVQHTVNALPTLDTIGYWQLDEDASEQTVSFSGVTSGLNENQPLKVTALSS